MLASEQVCLSGGKWLEVNTYEMARQSREAETKDSENEIELKINTSFGKHTEMFKSFNMNIVNNNWVQLSN